MTNEPQSESAQQVSLFQSAPARAWTDAIRFLSTASFWLMELTVALLVGLVVWLLSVPQLIAITLTATAPVTVLLLSCLFFLLTAPLRQRNEARKELTEVHERLRPKLRITAVNKTFDPDWRLREAMVDIEYLRLTVTNFSETRGSNCSARLLRMVPRVRGASETEGYTPFVSPDGFASYFDVPFPIELTWTDLAPGQLLTTKEIPPLGAAQVNVLTHTSGGDNPGLTMAFSSKELQSQYRLQKTEVLLAIRVDSDENLPYYYVIRYLPSSPMFDRKETNDVICEGPNPPDLEEFRV